MSPSKPIGRKDVKKSDINLSSFLIFLDKTLNFLILKNMLLL